LEAFRLFGLDVEPDANIPPSGSKPAPNPVQTAPQAPKPAPRDYSKFYAYAQSRLHLTDYPQKRGLDSEVARRFMLGFAPGYKCMGANGGTVLWDALIIPVRRGCYVARNINAADKLKRYRKIGGNEIYHTNALDSPKPVFVVEGEIDALSVITAGAEAMALGSLSNAPKLIRLVMSHKPKSPLIIALDNEPGADSQADSLLAGLHGAGVAAFKAEGFLGCKDANEALLADRKSFGQALVEMQAKCSSLSHLE
jgi:replicative DNA helicase